MRTLQLNCVESVWLEGLRGAGSLAGSEAFKKGRGGTQASMSAHDRAMVTTSELYMGGQRTRCCKWPCGHSDPFR